MTEGGDSYHLRCKHVTKLSFTTGISSVDTGSLLVFASYSYLYRVTRIHSSYGDDTQSRNRRRFSVADFRRRFLHRVSSPLVLTRYLLFINYSSLSVVVYCLLSVLYRFGFANISSRLCFILSIIVFNQFSYLEWSWMLLSLTYILLVYCQCPSLSVSIDTEIVTILCL